MNRRERSRKIAGKDINRHNHAYDTQAVDGEIDYTMPRDMVARVKKTVKRKKTKFMQKNRELKQGEPGRNQNYRANRINRDYE